MADLEHDWIRKRAYSLWEEEGYPAGRDTQHWERAQLEYISLKPAAAERAETAPAKKAAAKPRAAKATNGKAAEPDAVASKPAAAKAKPAAKKAATAAAAPDVKKRTKKAEAGV